MSLVGKVQGGVVVSTHTLEQTVEVMKPVTRNVAGEPVTSDEPFNVRLRDMTPVERKALGYYDIVNGEEEPNQEFMWQGAEAHTFDAQAEVVNRTWPGKSYKPLAELQEKLLAKIAERRWQHETGGVVINGMPVDTSDRSKTLIVGKYRKAEKSAPGATFTWKTNAGPVQITAATMIAIGDAIEDFIQDCFDREAVLIPAANALTEPADVVAAITAPSTSLVNWTAGWPSTEITLS